MVKMKKKTLRRVNKGLNAFVAILLLIQPVGTPGILGAIAFADETGAQSSDVQAPAPKEEPAPEPASDPAPAPKEEPKVEPTPAPEVPAPTESPAVEPGTEIPADATPADTPPFDSTIPTDSSLNIDNTNTSETTGTISPDAASTEAPVAETSGKICLENGANIVSSQNSDWNVDGSAAETKNKVELGVKYVFPGDDKVSVTFTCLPANSADRTTLKIEQINSADINLPDGVAPASEFAYDITTGMKDGDFEYDLTLPKADVANAEVNYIEKTADEAKNQELAPSDLNAVEDSKVKTENNEVKVSELDHFSVYLMISKKDSEKISTDKNNYKSGETVVITGQNFDKDISVELKITDPNGTETTYSVTADNNGEFSNSQYVAPGFPGKYTVDALIGGLIIASAHFSDPSPGGNPSADLDQCANGGVGDPAVPCTGAAWQNGNLNGNQAHYFEGDSVPYRMRFSNLATAGTHTVTIEWDTTQGGKHALDYITSFDRTETTANPCSGVAGCTLGGPKDNISITADPNVTGAGVTPVSGNITLFNGDITGLSAYTLSGNYTGNSSTAITITFTTSVSNPVLAWGGHIATRADWGVNNSAIAIPGSPYHTRLIDLDGSGGNQDRSLASEAVVFPGSITIVKQATPEGDTSFPFTASPSPLSNFPLVDDGTSSNTKLFSNITNFQTYSVAETVPSGWTLNGIACSVTSANGGSQTVNLPGVNIDLKEGENVTCTYTDTRNQVAPNVSTAIHDSNHTVITSADAGSTVHDSASVSGSLGTPTGDVTFDWFNNGTCTGTPNSTSGTFALSSGAVDATTFTQGPLNAGSYSFQAHYAGDSNYTATDSPCEPLTINKVTPAISTTPSAGGIVGIQIYDTANVTGGLNPTGTVTFNLYGVSDTTCSGSAIFTDTANLVGGSATSGNYTTTAAGTYHWKATYNGDSNNNSVTSPCADEPVTTNKATPTLTTDIHNDASHAIVTSVSAGSTVHDKASISGGLNPSGSVDFTFYSSGDCTTGGAAAGSGIPLVSGVAHPSSSEGPLNAGSYSFKAHYNGDANNNAVDSACEPLTVTKLNTTTTTQVHNPAHADITGQSVALGTTIHDSATVAPQVGSMTITGNVTYHFFTTGDCTGTPTDQTVAVGTESNTQTPGSGSYSYKADYSGDSNYNSSTGICEPVTISKSQLDVSTNVHDSNHAVVTNTSVPLNSVVHDQANLTGTIGGFTPPAITFTFYENNYCTGEGSSVANTGADSGGVRSADSSALLAGSYSYKASVAGDDNYLGDNSDCEPFTVDKADTNITTQVHDSTETDITNTSIPLGTVVHDKATVAPQVGSVTITGNVTYHFFTNGDCTGASSSETVAVGNESSVTSALAAGSYSFIADYSGDSNYNSSEGSCEPFSVNKAIPEIVTELHNSDESVIATEASTLTVHDRATVAGGVSGFAPSGNVEFYFFPNGECSGEGDFAAGTVALDGNDPGIAHPSDSEGPLAAGSYSFQAYYVGDDNYEGASSLCEPFTVSTLQIIKNTAGGDATFNFDVAGPTPSTPSITTVAGNGSTAVTPISSGTYNISEGATAGWDLTSADCVINGGQAISYTNGSDKIVAPGDGLVCTFTNTKRANVTVTKFNDVESYGTYDGGEEVLSGWSISLNPISGQTSPQTTDANGQVVFNNLTAGDHTLSETIQSGWEQTNIYCNFDREERSDLLLPASPIQNPPSQIDNDNSYDFSVYPGENIACFIGNHFTPPVLEIQKSNNKFPVDQAPGSDVVYTLTVTALENDVNGVEVTDLPPDGFTYRPGSESASSTEAGHTGIVLAHAYASPGIWDLGNMKAGETVTLSYTADISSDQESGSYPDLAWTEGKSLKGDHVLGEGKNVAPQFNSGPFVGTEVAVVRPGIVEGASVRIETDTDTEHKSRKIVVLPATGFSPWRIAVAILFLLGGAGLLWTGKRKKNGNNPDENNDMSNMTKLLVAGLAAASLIFGAEASQAATTLAAQMMTPKSPYQTTDFNLGFVAMDINSSPITVKCFVDGAEFQTVNLAGGGTSGNCNVNSGVIAGAGIYDFHIVATNGSEPVTTPDASVEVILGGPGTPRNYNRAKVSECELNLKVTTADDGGKTVRVEIYRSTERRYTADASTLVTSINVGSNQPVDYTDTKPDCTKDYYYAMRAFDALGNGSGVAADERTVVRTTGGGTTTITAPGGGAIPAGGATAGAATGGATAGGAVAGEETPGGEEAEAAPSGEEGQVLGEETASEEPQSFVQKNKALSAIIALVILAIIYYAFIRKKKAGLPGPPKNPAGPTSPAA